MGSYTVKPGARLTRGMRDYASLLADKVPSVPLTITSGERDFDQQASAMLNKFTQKGAQELYSVYKSSRVLIDELIKAPKTQAAWSTILRAKGQRLSRHLWRGAIDVRRKGLTGAQLRQVMDAVKATGGSNLLEYDHLHINLPAKYVVASGIKEAAAAALPGLKLSARRGVWVAVGVTIAAGVLAAYKYRVRQAVLSVGPRSVVAPGAPGVAASGPRLAA